jgi:hypothetical protein
MRCDGGVGCGVVHIFIQSTSKKERKKERVAGARAGTGKIKPGSARRGEN